ncbi:inheritance of peroxisomes protein 1-domain-containing protein [Pseudoneurospora amorphoporcata]|uniref:Inheritance of peroxisomes protein 1 n=1 Tax=Pseudoneurospora amorphoporcata TaxID=241081 RepID=A0AAN6NZ43_9PEZI|nr:inheritance of peroxisomes protein 1-domain-containing protein [Pseudoneurospora amorphoporcata]
MEFSNPFADTVPRRNFTAPIGSHIQRPSTSAGETSNALVDTLYDHPSVKITSFTAGSRPATLGPIPPDSPTGVEPGSLPWSSHLERTIAVGHFRIYRAPGSITFLNCGSALQPIFPKSQAWCVDEDSSKYILQIRRPQYWRIELPVDDPEDIRRAQLLREVFDQVLQFEKTECPFQRSFTVELPERPQTPVIKRPWTPARRSSESIIPIPVTAITIPAQIARVHRGPPKDDTIRVPKRRATGARSQSAIPASDDLFRIQEDNAVSVPDITLTSQPEEEPQQPEASSRSFTRTPLIPSGQQTSHSVAAPPQLTLVTVPHSTAPSIHQLDGHVPDIAGSLSSVTSRDSFHSVRSCNSHILPPSPPLSKPTSPSGSSCEPGKNTEPAEDFSIFTSERADRSNIPQTSNTSPIAVDRSATSSSTFGGTAPCPTHDDDSPCSPTTAGLILVTPSPNASPTSRSRSPSLTRRRSLIRGRATTSSSISPSRRALSPLPRAAELFAPRQRAPSFSSSKLEVVRKLPMTVINKSFEILMAPPTHLMSLMLTVAARITAGQKSGAVLGSGERGERIPVQWDLSDEAEDGPGVHPQRKAPPTVTAPFSSGTGRRWSVSNVGNDDDHLPPHMRGRERGMSLKMAGSFPESDDDDDDHNGSSSNFANGPHELAARRIGAPKSADDGFRLDEITEDEPKFDWSQSMGVD